MKENRNEKELVCNIWINEGNNKNYKRISLSLGEYKELLINNNSGYVNKIKRIQKILPNKAIKVQVSIKSQCGNSFKVIVNKMPGQENNDPISEYELSIRKLSNEILRLLIEIVQYHIISFRVIMQIDPNTQIWVSEFEEICFAKSIWGKFFTPTQISCGTKNDHAKYQNSANISYVNIESDINNKDIHRLVIPGILNKKHGNLNNIKQQNVSYSVPEIENNWKSVRPETVKINLFRGITHKKIQYKARNYSRPRSTDKIKHFHYVSDIRKEMIIKLPHAHHIENNTLYSNFQMLNFPTKNIKLKSNIMNKPKNFNSVQLTPKQIIFDQNCLNFDYDLKNNKSPNSFQKPVNVSSWVRKMTNKLLKGSNSAANLTIKNSPNSKHVNNMLKSFDYSNIFEYSAQSINSPLKANYLGFKNNAGLLKRYASVAKYKATNLSVKHVEKSINNVNLIIQNNNKYS